MRSFKIHLVIPWRYNMISKNDCVLLLTDLEESGVDIGDSIIKVIKSSTIPLDVLEFINSHRELDLTAFYEKLRKSYNNKKSKLYINIIKEVEEPDAMLTTLSSYALQAILFSRKVSDSEMFLKHARVKEVNLALAKYLTDFDLALCANLIRLLKADMMACEIINKRREP